MGISTESSLTLQKSRMPQVQGVEGEAVVIYREPLTTREMRYHRLSRRVNNRPKKALNKHITASDFLHKLQKCYNRLTVLFALHNTAVLKD
jgi:hypothetical protein